MKNKDFDSVGVKLQEIQEAYWVYRFFRFVYDVPGLSRPAIKFFEMQDLLDLLFQATE